MDSIREMKKNAGDAILSRIMAENFLELKYIYSHIKDHPPKFQGTIPLFLLVHMVMKLLDIEASRSF